ncbi:MAG: hypothetical protein ACI88C_001474 [Acidimicrobiales bacterium]
MLVAGGLPEAKLLPLLTWLWLKLKLSLCLRLLVAIVMVLCRQEC